MTRPHWVCRFVPLCREAPRGIVAIGEAFADRVTAEQGFHDRKVVFWGRRLTRSCVTITITRVHGQQCGSVRATTGKAPGGRAEDVLTRMENH